jgi:hypothetical protein
VSTPPPSEVQASPAPGWYEWDQDHERYWDGATWQGEIRAKQAAAPASPPPMPLTPPKPGWHPAPGYVDSMRYWDGHSWGDDVHPAGPAAVAKHVLWGLSLAFGAAGAVTALFGIPLLAYYWPLGLGAAGLAVAIAAASVRGETPWFAVLAVLASVGALIFGITAYEDFNEETSGLDQLQERLDNFGS